MPEIIMAYQSHVAIGFWKVCLMKVIHFNTLLFFMLLLAVVVSLLYI